MAVVTVSREMGSLGDQIANLLCEDLGYRRVDKRMLTKIAQEAGIDVKAVLAKERAVTTKPKLISGQMTSLYGRQPNAFGKQGTLDDQTYLRIVRETMDRFAAEGDAIIVGRGGQVILQETPGTLHVHLHADPEIRAQNLMERYGISKLDAQRRLEMSDERKRLYTRNVHKNANWKDPRYYHLMLDTGRLGAEVAARIIALAAKDIDGA